MINMTAARSIRTFVCLLGAAILTVPLPPSARQCRASEVIASWDLSRQNDLNFDDLPDGWKRVFGPRYPRYLTMRIRPHDPQREIELRRYDAWLLGPWQRWRTRFPQLPVLPPSLADAGVDRYLHAQVDGGGILAATPPFEVGTAYSYRMRARIQTSGLVHNKTWLELVFKDAAGRDVARVSTAVLGGDTPWSEVGIEPLACPPTAASAQVVFHYESASRPDMTGAVGLDDIVVERLPQIRMESRAPHGLYLRNATPKIRCVVSGLADAAGAMRFSLHDETGQELLAHDTPLRELAPDALAALSGTPPAGRGGGYGGTADWQLPKLGPGFYSVHARLAGRTGSEFTLHHTFAVLRELPSAGGPFGWSLTSPERPQIPDQDLPEWLSQCSVQWVKYPCWVGPLDYDRADAIAWLMGRLQDRGITPVGVLCDPPAEVLEEMGARANEPIALLLRDEAIWLPMLEPVMTRLSSGVRWWQLGGEGDFSFLGRAQLKQIIGQIRTGLQGFGPQLQIALNWPWVDPLPPQQEWSWQAVCLGDRQSTTAAELDAYFEDDSPAPADPGSAETGVAETGSAEISPADAAASASADAVADSPKAADRWAAGRPWIVLNPLPRDEYVRSERIRDLVLRMLAVRRQRIPAAFVSNPFDARYGVLRPDGSPDEMLLPWRTTAALVGSLTPLGSLQLPGHSQNVLLADDRQAVLVLWSDVPTTETLFVGDAALHLDAYGRELPIDQVGQPGSTEQRIEVTPQPTFLINIDRTAALWSLRVRLDRERIDSVLGRAQTVQVLFENPSSQPLHGSFRVEAPEAWNASSTSHPITAEPYRQRGEPITFELRNDATIGSQMIAIEFDLEGDRPRRFTVWRRLEVGPEDVQISIDTRLLPDGRLVVRQEMSSLTDRRLRFDCSVYARGRKRQRRSTVLPPLGTVQEEFYWADGAALIGGTMLLRAEEQPGNRTLNLRFSASP